MMAAEENGQFHKYTPRVLPMLVLVSHFAPGEQGRVLNINELIKINKYITPELTLCMGKRNSTGMGILQPTGHDPPPSPRGWVVSRLSPLMGPFILWESVKLP